MYTINVDVLLEVSIHVFTCRYVNQKKVIKCRGVYTETCMHVPMKI